MLRLAAATSAATLALTTFALLPAEAAAPSSAPAGGPTRTGAGTPPATGGTGIGTGQGLAATRTPAFTSGLRAVVHRNSPAQAALDFLAQRRDRFRIAHPRTDLHPVGTATSDGQTAVRLAQSYHGIPVLGAQYVVRMRDRGDHAVVTGSSGRYFTDLHPALGARVTPWAAAQVARRDLARTLRGLRVHDDGPVVLPFGSGMLTRHVTVTGSSAVSGLPVRKEVYVEAGRSTPVLAYDGIEYDGAPVSTTGNGYHGSVPITVTRTAASTYVLRDTTRGGGIETYDTNGADAMDLVPGQVPGALVQQTTALPFTNNVRGAVDAHWGAEQVYDFYQGLGRAGLDGRNGLIRSYVGVKLGGQHFANAFWDGQEMVFGDGGDGYRPFSAALDVVGHEMTHGVVQHTAGLLGFGQSGALNEGIADYFGNSIENKTLGIFNASPLDGLMGQDLCLNKAPVDCHDRNLDALKTTRRFFGDPMDNGGVHANSTIVSGAFWQLRKIFAGGSADQQVQAAADHRADQVMYLALTEYLSPLSDFLDARHAVVAAARYLGATPDELAAIKKAFDDRGVSAGWERRVLHVDSTALHNGLSTGSGLSVAGGRWVISDMGRKGEELPAIYTGDLRGGHQRRVSPVTRTVYVTPATDGRSVAWVATDALTGSTSRVQLRSLSGGRVRTLASYRHAIVWSTGLDGGTAAWDVQTQRSEVLVVKRPNGKRHAVTARRGHFFGQLAVRGSQVVWTDLDYRNRAAARLVSYDARSGRTRVLATVQPAGRQPAAIYGPTLTPHHLFYAADRGLRNQRSALVRADRNGARSRTVLRASNRHAPVLPDVTASDRAVTFDTMDNWHLWQLPAAGGTARRVSCATGPQMAPVAAGGTRVVWLELTTGDLDLVTRGRPAGTC